MHVMVSLGTLFSVREAPVGVNHVLTLLVVPSCSSYIQLTSNLKSNNLTGCGNKKKWRTLILDCVV